MRRMKKLFVSMLVTTSVLLGGITSFGIQAQGATCDVYYGDNVENQNYTVWSNPIESYLTVLADGSLMRVQYGSQIEGILVEYYNADYNIISSKIIAEELPTFGGYYATATNYFVVTGQRNLEESADTEVVRITKYDKDWNKIATASLKDCNTVIPFDAGSCRMDVSGKYMIIRTSHEMYKSEDGYNHQANMTIQLDTETMAITDSYADVMNTTMGYVSHSFNQFIKLEDDKIVAVDHGDAYPRSIVLVKYQTDISSGQFVPNYFASPCDTVDVLEFSGEVGRNATGASVGGFEISDSHYLVAGNTVVQDDTSKKRTTRNVFVAAVDKSTSVVSMKYLTSYIEGDGTTSTPQMVKISQDKYVVLWSRAGKVYYALVDGTGELSGTIYNMDGELSDCVPVVCGGKIVWYTWNDDVKTFYDIDIENISSNRKIIVQEKHDWDEGVVTKKATAIENGEKTFTCSACKTTKKEDIPALGMPQAGTAASDDNGEANYKVTKSDSKNGTVTYVAPMNKDTTQINIPANVMIDGVSYKVTTIADDAFRDNKTITNIIIGDNVTVIGKNAFSGCVNLKSVIIGKNVTTIGNKAFYNCKNLTKLTIPSKVTKIDSYAFKNCKKLSSVTIGKAVKTIGKEAFRGCSKLKGIQIKSKKLKTVGKNAFKGIKSSAKIKVPSSKLKSYKKLLKNKGQSKKVKITK